MSTVASDHNDVSDLHWKGCNAIKLPHWYDGLFKITLIQRYVAAERAHSFMVGINQSVAKTNKQLLKHLVRRDTGEAREAPWGDEWFSSETCRV